MNYEDLPAAMREQIAMLKHGSLTIEADINDAVDRAITVEEFQEMVDDLMDRLIDEAREMRSQLGSGDGAGMKLTIETTGGKHTYNLRSSDIVDIYKRWKWGKKPNLQLVLEDGELTIKSRKVIRRDDKARRKLI